MLESMLHVTFVAKQRLACIIHCHLSPSVTSHSMISRSYLQLAFDGTNNNVSSPESFEKLCTSVNIKQFRMF